MDLEYIAPALQNLAIPIAEVSPDPANVRRHPDRNLAAIVGSLRRFGQQRPIIADGRGVVVAGNGTLQAAQALGWTHIAVIQTNLVGAEAVAFAIADNRTAELAEWDADALAQTLGSLQADDAALAEAAGFTTAELAELLTPPAPPEPPAEFPEFGEDIATNCQCPKCGFKWSDGGKK